MTDIPRPSTETRGGQAHDETVERLLRLAGPRETAAAERVARMRGPVHEAWRQSVRRRAQRRWFLYGGAGLAAAASLLLAVSLLRSGGGDVTPVAETSPAAQLVAATGAVRLTARSGAATADDTLRVGQAVQTGASLRTGEGVLATLSLAGGGEVRLDAGTAVTLQPNREITIERGAVYVDSGSDRGAAPLVLRTPVGLVRDIGTRFEVRIVEAGARVRVRDGAVRIERGTARDDAAAGTELVAHADGRIERRELARHGAEWDWVARAAPPFRVEGQTLAAFLDWVTREGGWTVRFADAALERASRTTVVHGSIEGLTPTEALDVVLPTCGMTHHLDADHVVLERPRAAGGGRP
jgi:ferric-dicitrate binding protein FerR (iron transport regulator)